MASCFETVLKNTTLSGVLLFLVGIFITQVSESNFMPGSVHIRTRLSDHGPAVLLFHFAHSIFLLQFGTIKPKEVERL